MKNIVTFFLILFVAQITIAQNWQTDLKQAQDIAAKDNKKIILVFQGSDWCTPCIKLDHDIWQSEEFKKYAKEHFVMLKADFPRRKKNKLSKEQQAKNNKLAEKYNKSGFFPLVVVLDANGKVLKKLGYDNISPKEYIAKIES